jgi:hypothetical protein
MLSSVLLMLEVQTRWWKPALSDIGWHGEHFLFQLRPSVHSWFYRSNPTVGFWNLVGAVGFMLCGAFGYSSAERWVQQSGISTFWGESRTNLGCSCCDGMGMMRADRMIGFGWMEFRFVGVLDWEFDAGLGGRLEGASGMTQGGVSGSWGGASRTCI